MRTFGHLTPRYILNRTKVMIYYKKFPDHPWLTKFANTIITSFLKRADIGLEFGSGRSTIFFAQIVKFLTSVENDRYWYNKINDILINKSITNVDYLFRPKDIDEENPANSDYIKVCNNFPRSSLDFVLVDGIYRAAVANLVIDKLRPGGLFILDNANWYLPCNSVSPNSRTISQGPASPEWGIFLHNVENWRCIWTSNGVWDTALYLKPCQTN
jgi:hypothetical protein